MPKRNPSKPYPKLPPNVRRMLLRRDARVNQLEAMLASSRDIIQHGRGDRQGLAARLCELEKEVRGVYGSLQQAHIDRDRLAAMLADVVRGTTLHTQVSEPLPDDAQWVVCHVAAIEPGHWHRIVREGGEDTRTTIIPDNTPAEVQVPLFGAGMPGATLRWVECNHTVRWLPMWQRRGPLTCPAVGESPWPGVTLTNDIDGYYSPLGMAAILKPGSRTAPGWCHTSVGYPHWHTLTLPPATWRQA